MPATVMFGSGSIPMVYARNNIFIVRTWTHSSVAQIAERPSYAHFTGMVTLHGRITSSGPSYCFGKLNAPHTSRSCG